MKRVWGILILASSMSLLACSMPNIHSEITSNTRQLSSGKNQEAAAAKIAWPEVKFQLNALPGFTTQNVAEAQYARLEVYNKYNMAAFNRQYQLNFGDPEYMDPTLPLLASNANQNGFVPVNGQNFVIGAQVPVGPNWLVKVKLYSNPSPQGLIQELSAGFHLPRDNNEPVIINAETHLVGWALNTIQGINPVIFDPASGLGRPYIGSSPIDFDQMQNFMNGFMGLPPAQNSNTNTGELVNIPGRSEIQTAISAGTLEYPHLTELNQTPVTANGIPQARPPALSLDDLDRFAVGEMIIDKLLQQETLSHASGDAQWDPNRWRRPGYLVEHVLLNQRDSVGGSLAYNPNNQKVFSVNNAVINDIQETIHGIQLSGNGGMSIGFSRNDLERIESRFLSLGQSGTTNEDVVYLMSRKNASSLGDEAVNAPGRALQRSNLKQAASLVAVSQNSGQTLWQFSEWAADLQDPLNCECNDTEPNVLSEAIHFTPVVDPQPGTGDLVYTVLHSQGGNNDSTRGVYKILSQDPPVKQGYYAHDTNDNFTQTGALSSDGQSLYLTTKARLADPAQFLVINTADMSLRQQYAFPATEIIEETSSPIIGRDGRVYLSAFVSQNNESRGILYAFSADGALIWRFELPIVEAQQFGEYSDTTGQVIYPPILYNPEGQAPTLFSVTESGRIYSITDQGQSASVNWSHDIGARVFEMPSLIENEDGSLELYTASDTRIGRVFGIDAMTGERKWSLFPSGFFSTGFVVDNGFTYMTTRSGNYGDFTKFRSLKTAGAHIAPPQVSTWPKRGGSLGNTGQVTLN